MLVRIFESTALRLIRRMGISIDMDLGEESQPLPNLIGSISLSSNESSDEDLEGGNCDPSYEKCVSPEDGQKSKFISIGTGDAEFLRRQSQMGKLSLRRKSDRLPVRNQSNSFTSEDDDNDFMRRLSAINSIDPEEKSALRKSFDRLEQGLPASRSNSPTITSNKDKFLQHLRRTMSSRRVSVSQSPTTQAVTKIAVEGSLPETIQFHSIEDIEACYDKRPTNPEVNLSTYFSIKHFLIMLFLFIAGLVPIQNNKVSSLRSELSLSVASRDHLQKSYDTLITELRKYKDTHEKMEQVNKDLSSHTRKLREEHLVTKTELVKLRKTEKLRLSEVRLSNVIQAVQEWSRNKVIQK